MANATRQIYQTKAVFVSPSPATGNLLSSGTSGENLLLQLHRVQSANYSWSVNRQDVNQFGQLASIDRVVLDQPDVSFDFSYLSSNVLNEDRLGLNVDGATSAMTDLLRKTEDDKNYFIKYVPQGEDAIGYTGVGGAVALGNGFLTAYSAQGAVGQFPTCNVTISPLNIAFYDNASGAPSPAIVPSSGTPIKGKTFNLPIAVSGVADQVSTLRPGDIELFINNINIKDDTDNIFGVASICPQSYNLSFDLARTDIQCLGNRYAETREIDFPVNVSLSIDAIVRDLRSGNLSNILCAEDEYDLDIVLRDFNCTGQGDVKVKYSLKRATLDSENYSLSVGPNDTVTLNYNAQIGGPQDSGRGLFISGSLV